MDGEWGPLQLDLYPIPIYGQRVYTLVVTFPPPQNQLGQSEVESIILIVFKFWKGSQPIGPIFLGEFLKPWIEAR